MKNIFINTKSLIILLSILSLFILVGCRDGSDDVIDLKNVNWDFYNQRAEEFVIAVAQSDFDTAVGMFDEAMTAVVDADTLQEMWEETIITLAGEFIAIYDIENGMRDGFFISGVIMRHEEIGFGWNIVFSEDGLIAGINTAGTIPISPDTVERWTEKEQEPTQRDGFADYPVVIGDSAAFPLRAILSMPDDVAEQVPAVVIVHGSGPNNMDGTILGSDNALYREIAEFLAANGIAVIRYDKRTYTHGTQMIQELGGSLTVWEESIEDALLATEMLRADSRIDSDRIYIIGHSLGGILAPRIHAEGGDFAGLILLAATPRPLIELFIEQTITSVTTAIELGVVEKEDMADILADVDRLIELAGRIANMSDEEAKETSVPILSSSVYYLKDMMIHSFENYAQDIAIPILVMQGGRDFQILADVDFVLLQELFAGRDNVSFNLYDDLNHSFMPTTAENFIEHAESIMTAGNVYTPVLQDIVDWILH